MIDPGYFVPRPALPDELNYPPIEPVPSDTQRPYFSVMIPTLNRPDFLRKALQSVLDEGYGPDEMQICVVDNFTTNGDIAAIVNELGKDRVEYFRQPDFKPITTNWNSCLCLSRGQYVQLLHDDSVVLPGFYQAVKQHIEDHDCHVVFSQVIAVDKDGNWHGLSARVQSTEGIVDEPLQIITQPNAFMGNTLIAHRDHYEHIGGYYDGIFYGCDQELTTRLILDAKRVGFLQRPYVTAEMHLGQASRKFWISPGFRESDLFAWEMLISHHNTLPFRHDVYRYLSATLGSITQLLNREGHFYSSLRQAVWAYRLNPTAGTFWNIIQMLLNPIIRLNQRRIRPLRRARSIAGKTKRALLRVLKYLNKKRD